MLRIVDRFRWAVCQIDILQRKRSEEDIRKALSELPETLDETYERLFLEIPREDWPIARSALLWICAHDDLPFKNNMPSQCLVSAVLYETPGSHLFDLDALQEICGCLINVAPANFAMSTTTTVSLAHYTVREYLYSDRISTTSVSYFSLSYSITTHEYLKIVLPVSTTADPSRLAWSFWASFESYCYLVAWMSVSLWGWRMITTPVLKDLLLEKLWRSPTSLCLHPGSILYRWYDDAPSYSFFETAFLPGFNAPEWLGLANDTDKAPIIVGSLLSNRLYRVAYTFTEGRNLLEMLLHPLRVRTRWHYHPLNDGLPITNILEFNAADLPLKEPALIAVDFKKLIPYCTVLHCHELSCHSNCIIDWALSQGFPISPPDVRTTALQLAVHRWDSYGVSRLLDAGANVNEVGDPNGEIAPYTDTNFSACSPLHILRTGAYGLQHIEEHANLRELREKQRPAIEALLLEFGAQDFVVE